MKRRIEIIVLLVMIGTGMVFLILSGPSSHEDETDWGEYAKLQITTIRNLTDEIVFYSLGTPDSTESSSDFQLDQGEIHRIPTTGALEVVFERAGKEDSYLLEAGQPYNFRYNRKDKIQIYQGTHGRNDVADLAPYVATPMEVVEKMLKMAELSTEDILYDLGCGDGRIVIMAAKTYGAEGVGIDIDSKRIRECEEGAKREGVGDKVRFIHKDATKVDFSEATVITIYLLPESNAILVPLFEKYLKPGTRVISHNYYIPGWEHKEKKSIEVKDLTEEEHSLFLYIR